MRFKLPFLTKKSHLLRVVFLLVGAGIFISAINRFGGFQSVFQHFVQIEYFFLLIILNSFFWMLSYTEAWRQFLQYTKKTVRFLSLLKVKVSGEGVNFMTPLGFLMGDPVRVLMLKKIVGEEGRLRSVVVDRLMHTAAAQFFCLCGILLIFTQNISFPRWLHVALIVIYGTLCLFLSALLLCVMTGRGFRFFEWPIKLLRLHNRFTRVATTLSDIQTSLEYYKDKPKHPFLISFFLHFLGRVLGAVEIGIAFYCYEGHTDVFFSIILTALTAFFSFTFGFIPGAFGVLETVYPAFFHLYGFSPESGLSIQLVRRLRVLFWMAVGFLVLDYDEVSGFLRKAKQKRREKMQQKQRN